MNKTIKSILYTLVVLAVITLTSCEKQDGYFDWKLMNETWLNTHKSDAGFVQTESGLCYKIIRQGNPSDRQPNPGSYIRANYTGKLIDGSIFDTAKEVNLGQLNKLIKGFQEGMLMMHTGDIYEFYIPQELAYGKKGMRKIVPPYSVLHFEVELLDSGL